MAISFCVLSSGSCGNCSILKTDEATILIDCGCSAKYITQNLLEIGINPLELTAVIVTHAHTDHLSASALTFLSKHKIPIYFHEFIFDDVYRKFGDKADECESKFFDNAFNIKDIYIEPFSAYHKDSNVSKALGFTFSSTVNGKKYKIGYITDTGKISDNMAKVLANSNILVIESNYDEFLLERSFRPEENKRWVLSEHGHLGNEDAAKAIANIKMLSTQENSLKYVFLAHISEHHNEPDLALKTVKEIITNQNISDINFFTVGRKIRSKSIKIG